MPKKIALLFAGQGAQCVGMGHDLAKQFPIAANLFRQADEILGRNLSETAWNGPMEELTRTSNCQPVLYVHALAALAALHEVFGDLAVGVAKEYGIGRAMMLNVAGAYHSRLMESAYLKLEKALAGLPMQSPHFAVISNVTGREVKTPEEIRQTLRDQVTGTVRWTDCMQRLIDLDCDLFIELGPGNVLAGLLKRTNRDIDVISIGDAESVRKCCEAL